MLNDQELLERLAEEEGYEDYMVMLEEYLHEGTVPCICTNCEATSHLEPDQGEGWCENCESNTMVSCFILAGVM